MKIAGATILIALGLFWIFILPFDFDGRGVSLTPAIGMFCPAVAAILIMLTLSGSASRRPEPAYRPPSWARDRTR